MTDEQILRLICDHTGKRINLPNFTLNELKDFARAVLAADVSATDYGNKLHAAIMNISTDDAAGQYQFNDPHAHYCYKVGHRDARHAAAELAIRRIKTL